jgi:hypothetical protein
MRLGRFQHDATVVLAKRGREVPPHLVQRVLKHLRRKLAAFLDQIECRPQTALKLLAATEFLDARRYGKAMPLDGCAAQLEFDVLQISIEHAHLPRDVETHRRRFLKPTIDGSELLITNRSRCHFDGLFLDAAFLVLCFRERLPSSDQRTADFRIRLTLGGAVFLW